MSIGSSHGASFGRRNKMVRGVTCPECGVLISSCFGRTGYKHKQDCSVGNRYG